MKRGTFPPGVENYMFPCEGGGGVGTTADEIYCERAYVLSYIIVNFCRFPLFAYYFCLLSTVAARGGGRAGVNRPGGRGLLYFIYYLFEQFYCDNG